jgi:hypothetical protein
MPNQKWITQKMTRKRSKQTRIDQKWSLTTSKIPNERFVNQEVILDYNNTRLFNEISKRPKSNQKTHNYVNGQLAESKH